MDRLVTFNETVRYNTEEFQKFKERTSCSYEHIESLVFVFFKGVHIATYNKKTQILDTDCVDVFLK